MKRGNRNDQTEAHREGRLKKSQQRRRGLWPNICVNEERKRKVRAEQLFKGIMAEKLPDLMKTLNLQIKDAQ